MIELKHQHPITYKSTGNPVEDFKHAVSGYEADLSRYLPDDKVARILDVGCGWGQCLWWLRSKGYTDLTGIDPGADQEAHGRSLELNIIQVGDPKVFLQNRESRFNLIIMNHVIEHMPAQEGLQILEAIKTALKENGRIIVQTPNMNSIGANAGRYIEISHVTGYTESSLHQMMSIAGFENVEIFGNRTPITFKPRRLVWAALQKASRALWRIMLLSELGSDSPKVIEKNLYATAVK